MSCDLYKPCIFVCYENPRVKDWFMMSSPIPTLLLCLTYAYIKSVALHTEFQRSKLASIKLIFQTMRKQHRRGCSLQKTLFEWHSIYLIINYKRRLYSLNVESAPLKSATDHGKNGKRIKLIVPYGKDSIYKIS
uniref:Uncharacterized protein n=1 Tax=Megaselia scalaris TaxID=36166 RepID=T1GKR1_MEGSC